MKVYSLNIVKRYCSAVLIASLLINQSVVTAGETLVLTEKERNWIKTHPEVIVGNEMDWPPFDYIENGKPAGYTIDVVRLISQKTGLQLKFVNGHTWEKLLQLFKTGKIDILPAMYINESRNKYTLFTKNYYLQPSVMVVHENNKEIKSINDLKGKRVVGIKGFATTKTLSNSVPDIRMLLVNNVLEGLKAVSLGNADAFIDSIGTVSYILENNYIPNIKIISNIDNKSIANPPLHMGIVKNKPVLHSIFNKALASISREEKRELANRWFHFDSSKILRSTDNKNILLFEVNNLNEMKTKLFEKLTRDERDWLNKKPTIRLGIDSNWPPIEWIDETGNYQGMTSDYIKIISTMLDLNIAKPEKILWQDVLKKAQNGEMDILTAAVSTAERQKYLNFTTPYLKFPFVIFTRDGTALVTDINDIYGKRVGIEEGYTSQEDLQRDHPQLDLVTFKTTKEILHALSVGKIDAYVGNLTVAVYLINEEGLTNIKVAAPTVYNFYLSLGVRKDRPELYSILEKSLSVIDKVQRNNIRQRWLKLNYKVGVDYKLVVSVAIAAFIFLMLILIWVFVVKYQKKVISLAKEETDRANTKLKELDQLKSMFIASVSHELRTPLNAIIGFSSIMKNGLFGELSEKYLDYNERIHKSGQHLLSLITDIIDISKIESGNLDIEVSDFQLDEVIKESVVSLQQLADSKGIKIKVNVAENICLTTDKRRLFQSILNFLSNALKYSERGEVSIDVIEDTVSVTCFVRDTGIGISEQDIKNLFTAFERFESSIKIKAGGTGLGLYLTDKIVVDMLQGETGAESTLGKGSTFWLKIPKIISTNNLEQRT